MYSEYLRHFGVEDEIVACLPAPPGRSLRLLLRRDSGSFTGRDKLLVELLRLVTAGHSNAEIARQLFLSENTVRKHLENIYQRLSVSSRTAAVARAFQAGYLT